jgi:hypothetical protein
MQFKLLLNLKLLLAVSDVGAAPAARSPTISLELPTSYEAQIQIATSVPE